jgi:glycosyltransferase involved in cell wall biosynthesis
MKTLSRFTALAAKDTLFATAPPKVCMHVLGRAGADARVRDARVMREAAALVEASFELTIVDAADHRNQCGEEILHGVRIKHIIMPSWFIPTRFKPWFLVKAAQMVMRGTFQLLSIPADIYHAHDVNALPACYIAARLHGKALILDSHELPFDDISYTRWRHLNALARYILIKMLPRCAAVITASPLYAQEISKLYGAKDIKVIRNVPPYQTVPKSDRLRQHLGLGPEIRIALYQGGLQPNRGLDRLVRAAPFLRTDILIVMMGPATKETQSQLEGLILREGVADRIKILPSVPYEELLDWTASADIGLNILPPDYSSSIRRCLPNKLFEYLMAGIPVLTSELEAVVDVIRTYGAGLVLSSLAPADVAGAINAMLADQVALAHMSRNALEAAQCEFYWEKESQELIDLYRDILGIRHAG